MADDLLLVRADAGPQMGAGHLMRCLALAQAWRTAGGGAVFITARPADALHRRLTEEGFEVAPILAVHPEHGDLLATGRILAAHPGAWVVLDGYHFDETYQRTIREWGHPLLVIDDQAHLARYHAEVVLNQNLHTDRLGYRCDPDTQLLLGPQYALLRNEFLRWREWRRDIPEVARQVLVTLGGADPDNQTLKVIRALQQIRIEALEAVVVLGASHRHEAEVRSVLAAGRGGLRLERAVADMAELMAWADLAVSAGGSTCWELAFMGLPAIILVLADNQSGIAAGLNAEGVGVNLGWWEDVSIWQLADRLRDLIHRRDLRTAMSWRGRQLVDGRGPERVVAHMLAAVNAPVVGV